MNRMPEAARLQVAEQVEHVDPGRRVEHADDLVGDEQLDVEQERARDEHSLELAAAQLMRVLAEARRAGSSRTASSARSTFSSHSARPMPGKKPVHGSVSTRSALKIGLYELNGSWKTPCTLGVVRASAVAARAARRPAPSNVIVPRVTRESREDHPADRALPAPALADQRHDLAGGDLEADVAARRAGVVAPNAPTL